MAAAECVDTWAGGFCFRGAWVQGCALGCLGGEVTGKLGSSEQPRSSIFLVDRHLHHHRNTSLFLVQSWGGSLLPGVVGQWNLIKYKTPTMASKILVIVDFCDPWLTPSSLEPQGSPLLPEPPSSFSASGPLHLIPRVSSLPPSPDSLPSFRPEPSVSIGKNFLK